uniref:Zinc finger DNA binding protein n=1 Tax=Heliothis virescens TaxID=7102 RepID=A0A2A4J0J5_HELVI
MSVQRSPPRSLLNNLKSPNPTIHYSSDSAINEASTSEHGNYFNAKRLKRDFDDITPPSSPSSPFTNSEIRALFAEFKAQQDKKFEQLNDTLKTITIQNLDIQKSVEALSSQHNELLLKIKNLELENKDCRNRLALIENQLDAQEKNLRSTTVQIRNIPKQDGESKKILTDILCSIGSTLELEPPILESEIRDVYRTKSETLVVDFITTRRKDSLIAATKSYTKLKRENKEPQLNTSLIKLPGEPRTIFISEHLTFRASKIFYLARLHVKNKKLLAAWTSYGKVYIKEKEGSSPRRIDNETELNNLIA